MQKVKELEAENARLRSEGDKGLKISLPCEPGSAIYCIETKTEKRKKPVKCIKEYMVDHFKIGESKIPMIIACDKDNEWTDLIDSCKEGKEYFKTEEMARMRLEELEGAE